MPTVNLTKQPLAFVDIETNGGNELTGRVIEVGIIRVEQNRVVDSYSTLVNPLEPIPWAITNLTGITNYQLFEAPRFDAIAAQIRPILDGAIFIAHNVSFDYRFLQQEFNRMGEQFFYPHLCTVKLSRRLFPQYRRHSLASIIERFDIPVSERHRALADAESLWQFYAALLYHFDLESINQAAESQLKKALA